MHILHMIKGKNFKILLQDNIIFKNNIWSFVLLIFILNTRGNKYVKNVCFINDQL